MRFRVTLSAAIIGASIVCATGCVRRTITITSEPPGALVYLNDLEVGRTPVEVDFTYYGRYDVRLVREGFEPLVTHAKAKPPLWDLPPIDLLAEAIPAQTRSRIAWHFTLEPSVDEAEGLLERARELRGRVDGAPAPEEVPANTSN